MMKLVKIALLVLGIAIFTWGVKIMHSNYVHEKNLLHILKTGNENITENVSRDHSKEAAIDLGLHLGLSIIGFLLIISPIFIARKAHNKALNSQPSAAGTPHGGAH